MIDTFETANWDSLKATEGEWTQISQVRVRTTPCEIRVSHGGRVWLTVARECVVSGKSVFVFRVDAAPFKPGPDQAVAVAVPVSGHATHDAEITDFGHSETALLQCLH